jgi:hypothetical protein
MIDLYTCSDYQLLSTAEVAEALRISQASVRKLVRDGRLAAIGGFRVFYISAKAARDFVRANGMVLPQVVAQPDDEDGGAEARVMEMKR